MENEKSYRFVPHTADISLEVEGENLSALLRNAAIGMMEYMCGAEVNDIMPASISELEVEAPDRESLLVDWLSELILQSSVLHAVCVNFDILECREKFISARVGFAPLDLTHEIKAVTYNDLSVKEQDGRWRAFVTFDI